MRSTRVPVHLSFARLPVAALVNAFRALGRLPFRAHVEQVDEEVVGQRPRLLGEDAVLGPSGVGAEDAQAADENRHLRRGQPEELRLVEQGLLGGHELLRPPIVAEPVGPRLEHADRLDVRLLLRGVHASRREGNLDLMAAVLRRFLDRRAAAEHDQIGERHLLAALGRSVEVLLDRLELGERRLELGGIVDLPVLLGIEADARAVSSAALVGAAERRGRGPSGRNQLRDRKARRRESSPSGRRSIGVVDQRVIHGGNRVLPDQRFLRNERPEIADPGPMSRWVSLNQARANASAN